MILNQTFRVTTQKTTTKKHIATKQSKTTRLIFPRMKVNELIIMNFIRSGKFCLFPDTFCISINRAHTNIRYEEKKNFTVVSNLNKLIASLQVKE